MKILISLVAVTLLASCSTIGTGVQSAIPYLRPGVALATSGFLLVDSRNRAADIASLQKAAAAIGSNPDGVVTDLTWLRQVLAQYFPDQASYITLIGGIVDVAAALIPQLHDDAHLLQQAMHEISLGITDATNLYALPGAAKGRVESQRAKWREQYDKRPASMKRAAPRSKAKPPVGYDHFEFYRDPGGLWRWTHKAANNRVIGASSEGYANRQDCLDNAARNGYAQ